MNDICIATITLARDQDEQNVLQKSLTELSKKGFKVFITDGGSPPSFLEFLKGFSNFKVSEHILKGVSSQARNSLKEAYSENTNFILYTEPDKLEFFKKIDVLLNKGWIPKEKTGIFLFSRTKTAFKTYPPFQQMTETSINNCCNELLGHEFDYTYGPFILNRSLVPFLKELNEDIEWGWRTFIFGMAAKMHLSLSSLKGNFNCPQHQRNDDLNERKYRMNQLVQNIKGLLLSTTANPYEKN